MLKCLNEEQNKRFITVIKRLITFLIIGIAYLIFVLLTGLKLPCIFNKMFGKLCTGCGTTRMVIALVHLDFKTALRCNAFVFLLLIPAGIWWIFREVTYIKTGKTSFSKLENICLVLIFIVAIVFTILRNLEGFEQLCPAI